jgi:hypothetical protein
VDVFATFRDAITIGATVVAAPAMTTLSFKRNLLDRGRHTLRWNPSNKIEMEKTPAAGCGEEKEEWL